MKGQFTYTTQHGQQSPEKRVFNLMSHKRNAEDNEFPFHSTMLVREVDFFSSVCTSWLFLKVKSIIKR